MSERTDGRSNRASSALRDGTVTGSNASTGAAYQVVQETQSEHSSPDLEKWVDEVSRPGVIEPTGTMDGQPHYEIEAREVEQEFHSDLPPTTVWGYDGQYPGPTIEARQGEPIYVRWQNGLPDEHFLPVDTTIHSDMVPYDTVGSRIVTHLHGGNVEAESDGKPLAWFGPDFEETGPEFEKKDYYYVNDQPPTTLWYHDHSLGITRLNVYAGLAGFYLLRNDHEGSLGLPSGEYEIPLLLQDRSFEADGSLFYPTAPESGGEDLPEPSIVPQFFGDTSVVNGKAWPRLSVEPRKYRLRLLNGAQSRIYNLALLEYDEATGETGADGPPFTLIGNDGGLLASPDTIENRLELGTGKRADVIVDFSDYAGQTLLVHNSAKAPYRSRPDSDLEDQQPLPEVLLVDVEDAEDVDDPSQVPSTLTEVPEIPRDSVDRERYLPLTMDTDEYGRFVHLLGSEEKPTGHHLYDPVTENPGLGDTEIWSFVNLTGMSHPMHIHLVHFQVLGHEPYSEYDQNEPVDVSSLEPPAPEETGWNDVVTVDPGEVTHVIARFGEFEGLFNDQTGRYMWHCHMLEHEDYDMMRPFVVTGDDDGDELDVSCSRTVETGVPLDRTEGEPGNDLLIVSGEDDDGDPIC